MESVRSDDGQGMKEDRVNTQASCLDDQRNGQAIKNMKIKKNF